MSDVIRAGWQQVHQLGVMGSGRSILNDNPDEEQSDSDNEPYCERWGTACSSAEDKDEDDTQAQHIVTYSPQTYVPSEPEDWDAEILDNENPYDEEDLDDASVSPGYILCGDPPDCSYVPSLQHARSLEWSSEPMVSTLSAEAGQFEDAEPGLLHQSRQ